MPNTAQKKPYIDPKAASYTRSFFKIKALHQLPNDAQPRIPFSPNAKEYFSPISEKQFTDTFEKAFYNNRLALKCLMTFIKVRRALLGDKLKGAGIPCILFTTIQLHHRAHCLVSISGIQNIDVSTLNRYNEEKKQITQNIAAFWHAMNDFFKALSQQTNLSYVFLGHRSNNYDLLIQSVLAASSPTKNVHDTHKTCAEKANFNFLHKLYATHGEAVSVTGSQAFTFHPKQMREVPPCDTCRENIPAIRQIMTTACALSPTRARATEPETRPVAVAPLSRSFAEVVANSTTPRTPKNRSTAKGLPLSPFFTSPGNEANGDRLLNIENAIRDIASCMMPQQ